MKKISLFFYCTAIILLMSCSKRIAFNATVIKDCTGNYIRVNGKDYLICNQEKVTSFEGNAKVRVTYKKIDQCPELSNKLVCEMLHIKEGLVEIVKINN